MKQNMRELFYILQLLSLKFEFTSILIFSRRIVNIYENNAQTSKHLKLYHRTFLCNVMVRFGLLIFLKYFTENLIEAVGGYKDFSEDRQGGLERNWNTSKDQPKTESESNSLELLKSSPKNEPNPASAAKTPNEEFTEGEHYSITI